MKIFLNCEEANHICDKGQYEEAGFLEKIKLTFHLIFCLVCRKYTMRNIKLTRTIKNSDIKRMPIADKESLRNKLLHEMREQNQ